MARLKEFDEVTALESAMRAFWSTGFDGTSIQDLEMATGLTRTSIYNAYGNKRELFDQAITHYSDTIIAGIFERVKAEKNIFKAIEVLLEGMLSNHFSKKNPGGCLIALSILEKQQHEETSSKLIENVLKNSEATLFKLIKQAQSDGQLSKKLDAKSASVSIFSLATGSMILGKANFKKADLKRIVSMASSILKC